MTPASGERTTARAQEPTAGPAPATEQGHPTTDAHPARPPRDRQVTPGTPPTHPGAQRHEPGAAMSTSEPAGRASAPGTSTTAEGRGGDRPGGGRVLAVIPARGGSKGVPAKNLAAVDGVPLVARAVRECRASRLVTDVVVSTDDPGIAAAARGAGADVIQRPTAIAGDTATSEAAVLHAMDAHEAGHDGPGSTQLVLLVQCTSPFITREDIDGVVGAAYGMRADGFRVHKHRFFGHTALVLTDAARVLEIDDPHDLERARALAPLLDGPGPKARGDYLPTRDDIDAVVIDFDGTQTDDRVLIDSEGRELVAVHRGDELGIAAMRRGGIPLLILSTEQNPVVAARARKLRVPVLHGIDRKDLALKQWCEEQGIAPERVLYVGNDVNDLPCFGLVGWPVAVAGAHDIVRGAARAVTSTPGGDGAIREIASWILGKELSS